MQLNEVKKEKAISGPVQNDVHTQREKRSEKYVEQSRGGRRGLVTFSSLVFFTRLVKLGKKCEFAQCTPGRLTKVRARDGGLVY